MAKYYLNLIGYLLQVSNNWKRIESYWINSRDLSSLFFFFSPDHGCEEHKHSLTLSPWRRTILRCDMDCSSFEASKHFKTSWILFGARTASPCVQVCQKFVSWWCTALWSKQASILEPPTPDCPWHSTCFEVSIPSDFHIYFYLPSRANQWGRWFC